MTAVSAGAVVIGAGSLLFAGAAFAPVSWVVFPTKDPDRKLEIITNARRQWVIAQWLFGLGALVAAAGVGLLAVQSTSPAPLLYVSAGLLVTGVLPWSWHLYQRTVEPDRFAAGGLPRWPFPAYSLLTIAGLAVLGVALLVIGLPAWAGWSLIGAAGLFLAVGLILRDLPPFVHYVALLAVAGILLGYGDLAG